jgi:DNA polymerase-3 subunit delta
MLNSMPARKPSTPKAFIKAAAAKQFGGAFLLFGEDEFIKSETARRAVEAYIPAAERTYSVSHLVGGQTDSAEILAAASAVPLLGNRNAVVVHDVSRLAAVHKTRLASALERIASPALLLLIGPSELDRRTKFYKWFADSGRAVACHALTAAQADGFVDRCLSDLDVSIADDAKALLLSYVGPDAGRLTHESTKLVLFASPRRQITRADVAEVTGQSQEFAVEGLVEAQLQNDLPRSVHVARSLVSSTSDAASLIGRLIMHYFDLLRVLKVPQAPPWKLAGTLRMPTARVEQLQSWAKATSAGRVARALEHLADADLLVKSGRADPVMVFDGLCLALADERESMLAAGA